MSNPIFSNDAGLLTSEEAATFSGLSVNYVCRMAAKGRIPGAVKEGRDWRFSRRGLSDFGKSRRPVGNPNIAMLRKRSP